MVKREEYGEYLKNYCSKVKTCFMSHNSEWPQVRKIEKRCSNLTFDIFADSTNYLDIYKTHVSNDYDLIILNSSRDYSDSEFVRMKTMVLEISKTLNKRVTIGYCFYVDKPNEHGGKSMQILLYSVKDDKDEAEIIPISYEKQKLFDALDLFVIALDKHREYNNQKQFKK